jgi:RNA polymerase sigma-70 factor (ECF subfamily)
MIRISPIQGTAGVARLRVEGRVTRQTVSALQSACEASFAASSTLFLELSQVQFVDAAGIDEFHKLVQRGAILVGCSGFLAELLQLHNDREEMVVEPPRTEPEGQETRLLAGLRRGESEAFEQLVRLYGGRLLATARRLLGNEHDAQDALQEAFLSAFQAINQFTGAARLSTWLHRIVVNAALMKMRSRRRKHEESIEALLPRFDEQGEWLDSVTCWGTTSETLLQQQETRTRVRQCIAHLPETYRIVLLLRDIEELDTDETARLLHITANAVKIRLHRARQALRTLLERALADSLHAPRLPLEA